MGKKKQTTLAEGWGEKKSIGSLTGGSSLVKLFSLGLTFCRQEEAHSQHSLDFHISFIIGLHCECSSCAFNPHSYRRRLQNCAVRGLSHKCYCGFSEGLVWFYAYSLKEHVTNFKYQNQFLNSVICENSCENACLSLKQLLKQLSWLFLEWVNHLKTLCCITVNLRYLVV